MAAMVTSAWSNEDLCVIIKDLFDISVTSQTLFKPDNVKKIYIQIMSDFGFHLNNLHQVIFQCINIKKIINYLYLGYSI